MTIDLEKCGIKMYVFHFCKKGLTFREIYEEASHKNKTKMMCNMQGLKKMMQNWRDFKSSSG